MNLISKRSCMLVLLVFLIVAFLNWVYVWWVEYYSGLILNAWFAIIPLMSYFYFTFTFIACVGIYTKKRFGMSLAYGVLTAGMISAAISYGLVFRIPSAFKIIFILLVLMNICAMLYLASKYNEFQAD